MFESMSTCVCIGLLGDHPHPWPPPNSQWMIILLPLLREWYSWAIFPSIVATPMAPRHNCGHKSEGFLHGWCQQWSSEKERQPAPDIPPLSIVLSAAEMAGRRPGMVPTVVCVWFLRNTSCCSLSPTWTGHAGDLEDASCVFSFLGATVAMCFPKIPPRHTHTPQRKTALSTARFHAEEMKQSFHVDCVLCYF